MSSTLFDLADLLNQVPTPMLVTDPHGRIRLVNSELTDLMGDSCDDLIDKSMEALLPPASRILLQTHVWPMLMRHGKVREIFLKVNDAQGDRIPVLVNCHKGLFEGEESYYWLFFIAHERSRFEAALLEARGEAQRMTVELANEHELLQVTMKSIGDAVITTDAYCNITWMNPVAERLTGWTALEAKGRQLTQVFHIVNEDTRALTANPVLDCLQQGKIVGLASHTLLVSRDGVEFGIEDSAAPILNAQGDTLGAVLVFHDVTAQRRLSSEMHHRATHDALTGLINRTEFETRLQRVLLKAHEDESAHALLYIDIDQFKLINDACGHAVGDQLLQQLSKLLATTVRDRDTLARLGGDEFGVILEHCTAEQARRVSQDICDRMEDFRFIHDNRRFRIGASIGLVPVDKRWAKTEAILQASDSACYAAKEAGRNRVHVWFDTDLAMRNRHGEMQWTTRIEQALDEDRFVLYAQRIESLPTAGHGIHAEVLLRMIGDQGEVIPPGAFLPAAERFNLASRIDKWVLNHTIAWLQNLSPDTVIENLSVNLSGQSVGDKSFHVWAMESLQNAGPQICSQLCFEITETAAITNLEDAAAFIKQLRAHGMRVALDDFGAGASSFGYLKSLPVDYLKIDGQFIRDVVDDPLDDAAVRCFVDVARVLQVKTVAEFVDNPAVLERLKDIGVDYVQGYLLHKPEPLDTLLLAA
jgi:diguanylate cyclase (GGDEF)-like protein/PAS domain S-box-containing protein